MFSIKRGLAFQSEKMRMSQLAEIFYSKFPWSKLRRNYLSQLTLCTQHPNSNLTITPYFHGIPFRNQLYALHLTTYLSYFTRYINRPGNWRLEGEHYPLPPQRGLHGHVADVREVKRRRGRGRGRCPWRAHRVQRDLGRARHLPLIVILALLSFLRGGGLVETHENGGVGSEAPALVEVAADDEGEELGVALRGGPPDVLGEGGCEEAHERVGLGVVGRGERAHGEASVGEGVRVAESSERVELRDRGRREEDPTAAARGGGRGGRGGERGEAEVARRVGVGEEEVGVPGDGGGEGEKGGRGHRRGTVVQ